MTNKTNTTLIVMTNASSLPYTFNVELRWTTTKFPALSRVQRALTYFLKSNEHWLAEDDPEIVAIVQSKAKMNIKQPVGLAFTMSCPLNV